MIMLTFQLRNVGQIIWQSHQQKVNNLITAVKTVRLLEVDVHPNFRTLMEHKAFLSTWCRTLMHTREKHVLLLNASKISLSPAPRVGPSHVMFVRTSRDSESQDATEKSSTLAGSRNYSLMKMMTLYISLGAKTISLSVSPSFSSSVMTMSTSRCTGVCMTNHSCRESILEEYYCKEEKQYDSELESEDDEWTGTENHWCPLLDLSYHYAIEPVLLGLMGRLVISAS